MSTYVNVDERDPGLVYFDDPDALLDHSAEYQRVQESELIEAELIERTLASRRLGHFVARFTPEYIPGWHLDEIAAECEQIEQMIQRKRGTDARLILEAPPRHGKSQTTSRCLPLWYLGRHPNHEIIVATYGQDLADDLGRWAKACLKDPAFRAVFPDLELRKDSQAANRLDTTKGGGIRFVGVGASLTGRGGHLIVCVGKGQRITTKRGLVPIEDVRVGDTVMTHKRRWRRVKGVKHNGRREVIRVHAGGHSLVCTPEHKVYSTCGWQAAAKTENIYGYEAMSRVRSDNDCEALAAEEATDLLSRLSLEARPDDWEKTHAGEYHVSNMPDQVSPSESHDQILLKGVQERGAQDAHAGRSKPELQRRGVAGALHAGVCADERTYAPEHDMPGVPERRGSGSASHRRDEKQRCGHESARLVPWVSHEVSQVERLGFEEVYDLEVEEDSSFVCEGFVVHNCDDLVKDAEAADSEAISEATWSWYTSVLRTRLAPGGGIIVMHTRWRLNDPIGRLLKMEQEGGEQYKRVSFPASNESNIANEWGMKPGEVLHPERFSPEDMAATKRALPARDWLALYMQKPMADEGNIFKVHEFDLYPAHLVPKRGIFWGIACDLAFSQADSADYSVIMPFGIDHNDVMWFHPDYVRERLTTDQSIERILDYAHQLGANIISIEGGQAWKAIEPEFMRRMRKRGRYFTITNPQPTKDKYTRSRAIHTRMQAGMVRWPDTQKFKHLTIPEFTMFTGKNDDHDDQVDACFIGETQVATNKGHVDLKDVAAGDLVLTPKGYRPVKRAWCSGEKSVVTRFGLTGTQEHRVWTCNRGWVRLDSVDRDDVFTTCEKPSFSKGEGITDTQMTSTTTAGRTLCASPGRNTTPNPVSNDVLEAEAQNSWNISVMCAGRRQSGMAATKGASGTANTPKQPDRHSAPGCAAADGAKPTERRVYDLEVEDCPMFFANGVLVHNCAWAGHAVANMVRPYSEDTPATYEDDEALVDWSAADIDRRTLPDASKSRKHIPLTLRGEIRGKSKRYGRS